MYSVKAISDLAFNSGHFENSMEYSMCRNHGGLVDVERYIDEQPRKVTIQPVRLMDVLGLDEVSVCVTLPTKDKVIEKRCTRADLPVTFLFRGGGIGYVNPVIRDRSGTIIYSRPVTLVRDRELFYDESEVHAPYRVANANLSIQGDRAAIELAFDDVVPPDVTAIVLAEGGRKQPHIARLEGNKVRCECRFEEGAKAGMWLFCVADDQERFLAQVCLDVQPMQQ